MKKLIVSLSLAVSLTPPPSWAQTMPPDPYNDVLRSSYGLWENTGWVIDTQGDLREDVQYVTEGAQPRAYIRRGGKISFVLASVDTTSSTLDTLRRLDMELVGEGAQHPDAVSFLQKGYMQNFYLPHCGQEGVTNVRGYNRILYPGIYQGIDMWMYSGQLGQKLMFVIHPGAHPADLQMQFTGQDQMDVDMLGWLKLQMGNKWIRLPQAVAYQYDNNNMITPVNWTADYLANNGSGVAGFNFEAYDITKPLVLLIGPPPAGGTTPFTDGVCWSTYFGGTDWDNVNDLAVDHQGNQYVTGSTRSAFASFPHTLGNVYWASIQTMFLTQFGPNNELYWTDFFGGTSGDQTSNSLAIRNGPFTEVFIGGMTTALNIIPIPSAVAYTDPTPVLGNNGFIARFNAAGGDLTWSTYFGNGGFIVQDIAIDPNGQLLAVGSTSGDLPEPDVTPPMGSEDWPFSGDTRDGWIAKFTLDEQLLWATYVGGHAKDAGMSICAKAGEIIMTGETQSATIHNLDPGNNAYFQPSHGGGDVDLFIKEFNTNGVQQWGTFFGGNGSDNTAPTAVDVDAASGDIFIVGSTNSVNLDTENGDGWYDALPNGGVTDGFVAQFHGTDRSPEWISYIGGAGKDHVSSVAISTSGRIFLGGGSNSEAPFPFTSYPGLYSVDELIGDEDGFMISLSPVHTISWSTRFGGDDQVSTPERIIQLALDGDAQLYAIGATDALYDPDNDLFFPLTDPQNGAWFDDIFAAYADGFISRFCLEGTVTSLPSQNIPALAPSLYFIDPVTLGLNSSATGSHDIEIFDGTGRLVLHTAITAGPRASFVISTPLSPGVYWTRINGRPAGAIFSIR